MKRLIALFLLVLLLCGCTTQPGSETTVPAESMQTGAEPTEPAGSYVPDSEAETLTQGALRCYSLDLTDCYGIEIQGEDVLVFSGTESTTITRLAGDNLYVTASAQLDCFISPEDASFQAGEYGITYFNSVTGQVVFLDHDLKEVNRIAAPEGLVGKPILSSNRLKLYYCSADAVRVLDLETGLDRMLKSLFYPIQSVSAILKDDSVLCCSVTDEWNEGYSLYLSVDTGETVWDQTQDMHVSTDGERYFSISRQGEMNVLLFGEAGTEAQMLIPEDPFALPEFLEERNALVTIQSHASGSNVDYYDLSAGQRTASVDVPADAQLCMVAADGECGYVYFLGQNPGTSGNLIFRWDPDGTPVEDAQVYSGPYYTLENPDEAGLASCRDYASSIGEKYGVEILVGPEAAEVQPWDYRLTAEYHVPVIMRELQKLEQYLAQFPEDFFPEIYGQERICLVREIRGTAQSGNLDIAGGLQFWEGDKAYVALAAGSGLEHAFYHEIFHIIDNQVLSACNAYYYWRNLNPEGFQYDESFDEYRGRDGGEYLQDETRAFIDSYSMTYAKEDRARIMEYACTSGNAQYFQTEIMQNKLRTLCEGIRTAFGMKNYPEALLWEQYLTEPLTP